jgi:hypothetical protein
MQRTSLGLAILTSFLVIIFLMQPIAQMPVVEANPFGMPGMPIRFPLLEVHSPTSNPYFSSKPSVDISFDYYVIKSLSSVDHFYYSLDGYVNSVLTSNASDFARDSVEYSEYSVSKTLENLAEGNHSVTVYTQFLNGTVIEIFNKTIIFDPNYEPSTPLMISPLNQTTYNTKDIPVIFTINSNAVGDSLYCLDPYDWMPSTNWKVLIGNGTSGVLANVSDGPHVLKLKIWDESHTVETQTDNHYIEYTETVYFNVDTSKTTITPSPSPTPIVPEFPATITIIFLVVAALAVAVVCKRRDWCL